MEVPSTRTPLRKKLALMLLAVVLAGGALEALLRIAGFEHYPVVIPPIIWNGDEDRNLNHGLGMFVKDKAQLWVPRPGVEVPYGAEQGEKINSAGYRGPLRATQPPAGVVRILALGDSSTFGMGVPYQDTWCAQLESLLVAQGVSAEVIDAGVIGFTIDQGLERYEALGRGLSPDIVIAAFGATNEHIWANSLPDRPKIDLFKQPATLRDALMVLRRNLRILHLAGWVVDRARGEDREAIRAALKKDRMNRDEFNLGVGKPDWPGQRRVGLERFAAAHDELAARVQADGASLVLVSMPRGADREVKAPVLPLYNQAVQEAAQRLNAGFLDARAAVTAELAGPPPRPWSELFLDAYHPTRAGHALIAARLEPIVRSLASARTASSPASGR
ncbi:MAG: GDSL-type esterase/lipase family protein [Planctomycetota bacterium]